MLLDTSTAAKRAAIARIEAGWIAGCATAGYQAVEPDNLDSWTRSHGLLDEADDLAMAALLASDAHAHRLAIAQKNTDQLGTAGRDRAPPGLRDRRGVPGLRRVRAVHGGLRPARDRDRVHRRRTLRVPGVVRGPGGARSRSSSVTATSVRGASRATSPSGAEPRRRRSHLDSGGDDSCPGDRPDGDGRSGRPAGRVAARRSQPQQLRGAVVHAGSPLLIVAGAGSGKTRVLTHRIAYLLAARQVRPGEVLAITFTNKAAGEMKERVAQLVGPRAKAMWVSTFHSACVRILREQHAHLGFTSSFSIYDQGDSQRLVTLVCRDLDLDSKRFPARALAHQISDLKNELVDPESAAARASNHVEKQVAEVYASYQARLKQANAMDFDDLIMRTVELLQVFPDVAAHYRRRFRHVLVDEYQDTNHAQYVLVRELAGHAVTTGANAGEVDAAELCVVGDADQSIYAFRGASIRNIVEFERDYPEAHVVLLEQNYRSTQTVLAAANAVIARNPDRVPKNLWSAQGRRPQDHRVRRRRRARRGGVRRRGDRPAHRRARRRALAGGRLLPDQRAVARVRGGVHPRRAAYKVVGGCASTSGARSATCWRT